MSASGYSDYRFIFYIPKWYISSTFIWIVLLTSLSVIFFFFIVLRIQNKLQKEVFRPLEGQFFSKEKMNISELDKLREKISKAQELDKKRAKFEAKQEAEHKFAHNIQSPLRNIKVLKERLSTTIDDDSINLLDKVVTEISDLTESYVEKASSDESLEVIKDNKALVEICSLIDESVIAKNLELSSLDKKLRIFFENKATSQTYVEVVQFELRSIISNVLNNAVDSGSTNISVKLSMKNNSVRILIKDNGRGVHPDIISSLFEKNITYGKEKGTGFGLYHARKFIESWNGSVSLKETSEQGSTFEITLPTHVFPKVRINEHHQIIILEDKKEERQRLKRKIFSSIVSIKIKAHY